MARDTFQLTGNAAAIYEEQKVPAIFRPLAQATLDAIALRPNERVLDAACGTGIVGREVLARLSCAGRVTGFDLNTSMIDVARRLTAGDVERCRWHVADVCSLPFDDGAFSVVICQQGLQFFPDEDAALRELHRVLEPDGRIAMTVWAGPSDFFKSLAAALGRHVGEAVGQQSLAPFVFEGLDTLPARMSKIGFADIDIQSVTVSRELTDPGSAIPKEITGNPVGPAVNARGPEVMAKIVSDVMADMADYQRGNQIVVPQSANLVLARVR
jgi:ubiquinone/menaquinone biosynthesis C-methylase UbiE